MAWQAHPEFDELEDSQILWRYMPFASYAELIRGRALHFVRMDRLRDPHEGRGSVWGQSAQSSAATSPVRAPSVRMPTPKLDMYAVSCWSALERESISQWERYGTSHGVAVRTTFQRLKVALASEAVVIHAGRVRYGHQVDIVPGERVNMFRWIMRKRPAYLDEHEVRAVIWSGDVEAERFPSLVADGGGCSWPVDGWSLAVDLNQLVEQVWTGPPWTSWFHELVMAVSVQYGIPPHSVRRSELMDPVL